MNLLELRRLASKLNKEDKIVGLWKMPKAKIIEELNKLKYRVVDNLKELHPTVAMRRRKKIKLN
jgi:hypothetical protein